jgi:hypothetical protein
MASVFPSTSQPFPTPAEVPFPLINVDKLFGHLLFEFSGDPIHDWKAIRKFTADFGFDEQWVLRQIEARIYNLSETCH